MKSKRLKGKKLIALYRRAYERDGGLCKCGRFVEPGTPPHHSVFRSQGGGDVLENLETLCLECHSQKHF